MNLNIINKIIENNYYKIGLQGENNVEVINFIVNRYYNNLDLFENLSYLYYVDSKNNNGVILLTSILETKFVIDEQTKEEIEVETGNLIITWLIGKEITQNKGLLQIQIVINGLNSEVWKSDIATFSIANSLTVESPNPVLFRSRPTPFIENSVEEPPITISNRKIIVPSVLQNIAVQNDINSEAVKIVIPRYFDNNDLSIYTLWLTTVSSGGEDNISLDKIVVGNTIEAQWILKPPQTSYAGNLQLQFKILGDNFEWKSEIGKVNILLALEAEPVIPIVPDFIDEILKRISEYMQRAETAAVKSESARDITLAKADEAKTSADNAKVSEANSKASEVSSANSLTDINTGLVSKLPITQANTLIKNIALDENTGIFTFTRYDNSTLVIDTALEKTIINFDYDSTTKELILVLTNGKQLKIPMSSFINIYTGETTATIQTLVVGSNKITATIRGNSISMNLLDTNLQNTINSKVTANEANNASQIKFNDGQSFQDKLDNGSLKGNDGVSISTNSFYRMYVTQTTGDLMIVVADGAEKPPFTLKDNGDLVYII